MNKFFFDRVSRDRSEYDYRGLEFPTLEKARQLAELIALDLGIEDEGSWAGWTISVRSADGKQLLTIPVRAGDRIAA